MSLTSHLLLLAPLLLLPHCHCGRERWPVKVGSDLGAIQVKDRADTTIAELTRLPAPARFPEQERIAPVETTIYTLTARLILFKREADRDYHLVITDENGNTMIAEIPDPNCASGASPFLERIREARSKFETYFNPHSGTNRVNVRVRITGVGFFDRIHGQTGVARNGIELHPVLSFEVLD